MAELNDQQIRRREELSELRELGVDPFPPMYDRTHTSEEVRELFDEEEEHTVRVAGRIMSMRKMGKATFAHVQDAAGRIQVYLRKGDIEQYDVVKLLDIGDIIGVSGKVFKTRVGEISVHADGMEVLCKSLAPIPVPKETKDDDGNVVIHDAFKDKETRYRQRYLDLVVNHDIKDVFVKRSRIISAMRRFFDDRGWLEVETPVLQPMYGGASARPFVTHHNTLDMPFYLRIADELYLKRLIVGGFEGVYEISKNFRNEGMDRTHNPEYTAMEIYVAYKDYNWMMEMTEQCLEYVCSEVNNTTEVVIGEHTINFAGPYKRISMLDAIGEATGQDISSMSTEELATFAKSQGVEIEAGMNRGKLIDELFSEKVEDSLIQPTFITDYPVELSPLAKRHRDNPDLTERFELFVNGAELANAFSELNDALDQRARLEEQAQHRADGDEEAMVVDEDFLHALEVGLPPTAGLGIGIDRLVMLLTNNSSIRDVLFFPQMRNA